MTFINIYQQIPVIMELNPTFVSGNPELFTKFYAQYLTYSIFVHIQHRYLDKLKVKYSCWPETLHASNYTYEPRSTIKRISMEYEKKQLFFNGSLFVVVMDVMYKSLRIMIK